MRSTSLRAWPVIGLPLLAATCVAAETPVPPQPDPQAATPADQMVSAALRLELDGKNTERNALLQQALDQAPDHPPARWHLGYVRAGEQWLTWERQIDDAGDRWQKLYLYRKTRAERGDTVDDHFFMADGARERSMRDEERAHLRRIVELDYDNAEARARLGDVLIDDVWVTREEIVQFIRDLVRTRAHRDAWDPRVQPIVRRLLRSQKSAWEQHRRELAAIRDPAAIPSVETALAAGDERASMWYLDWLDGLDAWEAAVAMARQSVLAPSAAVRTRAQTHLKRRRVDDYVPVLLGAMRADPQFSSRAYLTPRGALVYVQHIAFETQYDVRERNLAVLYGPENRWCNTLVPILAEEVPLAYHRAELEGAIAHLRRYYQAFTPRGGRETTSAIEVGNDRVVRVLSETVGTTQRASPRDWWEWWNDYQQVEPLAEKPRIQRDYEEFWATQRRQRRVRQTRQPVVYVYGFPSGSCFAPGTPVVTEYGPKPIDEIELGDRVLSQDVETGELAFKPVFKTTVRPPVALMKVTTDRGELLCTGGHPFWVNGESWLYARELQPGMRFHSIDGASEILATEDAGREVKAHNLIVADFHTYFAGDGKVLSHDNTPRAPTNALVPGLMPDYAAAGSEPVVTAN